MTAAATFLERKHAAEDAISRVVREQIAPLVAELGATDCQIELTWIRFVNGKADPIVNLRIAT